MFITLKRSTKRLRYWILGRKRLSEYFTGNEKIFIFVVLGIWGLGSERVCRVKDWDEAKFLKLRPYREWVKQVHLENLNETGQLYEYIDLSSLIQYIYAGPDSMNV